MDKPTETTSFFEQHAPEPEPRQVADDDDPPFEEVFDEDLELAPAPAGKEKLLAMMARFQQEGMTDEDIEALHDLLQEDKENLDPLAGIPDLGIGALEHMIVEPTEPIARVFFPMRRDLLEDKYGPLVDILEAAKSRTPGTGLLDAQPAVKIRLKLKTRDVRKVQRTLGSRGGGTGNLLYYVFQSSLLMAAQAIESWEGDWSIVDCAEDVDPDVLGEWATLPLPERYAVLDGMDHAAVKRLTEPVRAGSKPTERQRGN